MKKILGLFLVSILVSSCQTEVKRDLSVQQNAEVEHIINTPRFDVFKIKVGDKYYLVTEGRGTAITEHKEEVIKDSLK